MHLLTIYIAYKLKNGHFLVKNGHFWDFTHHIPHSALGWGQFRTSFSSTLRDDKNKVCLLTIYLAYKRKNGHFLVTMAIFDILPTTFPTVHWDEDNFAKFFFWPLLFFMLDHDILAHCASYKFMNEGDFNFFQWEISINRWETPKISENPCLPRNLKFS